MSALPLFDQPSWRTFFPETEQAIAQAGRNANDEWMLFALLSVKRIAETTERFTADQVAEFMEAVPNAPTTHENRAMGTVMRMAFAAGWIAKTGEYTVCSRANQHNCPKAIWRSLIYRRMQ